MQINIISDNKAVKEYILKLKLVMLFTRDNQEEHNMAKKEKEEITIVEQQLCKEYADPKELYLPNGKADDFAKKFSEISNRQLRKVLNTKQKVGVALEVGSITQGLASSMTAKNIRY